MFKKTIFGLAILAVVMTNSQLRGQSVYRDGNALVIDCRNGADENVRIAPSNSYDVNNRIRGIVVTRSNGSMVTFSTNTLENRGISQIRFNGASGDDTCELLTNFRGETLSDFNRDWGRGAMRVVMRGGTGDDDLIAGEETNDFIDGGGDDDVINPGKSGNDTVMGGSGRDIFELYYKWTNVFPYREYTTTPLDYDYFEGDRIYGTAIITFTYRFR